MNKERSLAKEVAGKIRAIPDFPKKGILFRDITPLLGNGPLFKKVIRTLAAKYKGKGIRSVVSVESRGFIFGSALAFEMGIGFVPLRKPGKLPWKTIEESYDLEYGSATLQIHKDAVKKKDKVLIVDDLLATGGTAAAAIKLVEKLGARVVENVFIVELTALKGRAKLAPHKVYSLLKY